MTRLFDDDTPTGGRSEWSPIDGVRHIRQPDPERTRTHHVVDRDPSMPIYVDTDEDAVWGEHRRTWADGRRRRAAIAPVDAEVDSWEDGAVDDDLEYGEPVAAAPRRGRVGVDPLLLRIGAIVAAAVLVTPVALAMRDQPDDELMSADVSSESTTTAAPRESTPATLSTALTGRQRRRTTTTAVAMVEKRTASDEATEVTEASEVAEDSDEADVADVETTAAPQTTSAPACAAEYEVGAGDYWVRLADASGAGLGELLAVNGASSETALYPGDVICLPAGAQQPAPPPAPTTEAPTTAATTDPPTTPAPTDPPTTPRPTDPPTTPAPTRPPTTTAPPPPPPPTPRPDPEPPLGVWDRLAECESGGNWSINTGNGYYGGLQFSLGSWQAVGGSGYPHEHSRAEQIRRAEILLDLQGWGAWPACSRELGLR